MGLLSGGLPWGWGLGDLNFGVAYNGEGHRVECAM